MSVANLEAYALSQGIKTSYNEMTQAEQTTLRYNYLLSVTKDAQGDFGRTLETSFPNQVRVATMQLKSYGTTIGQEFLPIFLDAFKKINQGLKDQDWSVVGEGIADAINGVLKKFADMAPKFADAAAELIASLAEGIVDGMPGIVKGITTLINKLVQKIIELAPTLVPAAVKAIAELAKGLIQALPKIVEAGIKIIFELVKALTQELPKLIPVAVDCVIQLVQALIDNIGLLVDAAIELALGIAQGIIEAIPQIVEVIPDLVVQLIDALVDKIPDVVTAAGQLLGAIAQAIPDIAVKILEAMPQIIGAIIQGLAEGVVGVLTAVVDLFTGAFSGASAANEEVDKSTEKFKAFGEAVAEATPHVANYDKIMGEHGRTIAEINSDIEKAESEVTEIIRTALREQGGLRHKDFADIAAYNQRLAEYEQEKVNIYLAQQTANLALVEQRIKQQGDLSKEQAIKYMSDAAAALDKTEEQIMTSHNARRDALYNTSVDASGKFSQEIYDKNIQELERTTQKQLDEAGKLHSNVVGKIKDASTEWINFNKDMWNDQSAALEETRKYLGQHRTIH